MTNESLTTATTTSNEAGKTTRRHGARASRLAAASAFLCLALAASGSARAAVWSVRGLCAFNIGASPQAVALRGNSSSGPFSLEAVWSNDQGSTWSKGILFNGSLRDNQIACASDGSNQAIVVVRDTNGFLHAIDRVSGWQESTIGGSFAAPSGNGMTLVKVTDQNKTKFVLFAGMGNNQIGISIYDDTTNPKWSNLVVMSVPGSGILNSQADMSAVGINIGNGALNALLYLWIVDNGGTLWLNIGGLSGARAWFSVSPPAGTSFSPNLFFGPAAFATRASVFGHPGPYTEGDYVRRVTLPTADRSQLVTCVGGPPSITCSQLGSGMTSVTSGPARGCFSPGEPCPSSTTVTGITPDSFIQRWYGGTTDGVPTPPAGWTAVGVQGVGRTALIPVTGSNYGGLFLFSSSSQMAYINLDQSAQSLHIVGAP